MGIFKKKNTIGRSSLSKEDLDHLIDLQDPYRTDYSYVRSRSYRKDGSEAYENPRMFRYPMDFYRRKWALEDAWNRGVLTFLVCYIMDFCHRAAGNPSTVFKSVYRTVYFFFRGFLSGQKNYHSDLSWSSNEEFGLSTSTGSFTSSHDLSSHGQQADVHKQNILLKFSYRLARTIIYFLTLGYFPRDYFSTQADSYVEVERMNRSLRTDRGDAVRASSGEVFGGLSGLQNAPVIDSLENSSGMVSHGRFAKTCADFFWNLISFLLVLLLVFLITRWLLASDNEKLAFKNKIYNVRLPIWFRENIYDGLETVKCFGKSFVETLTDMPSMLLANVRWGLYSCREKSASFLREAYQLLFPNSAENELNRLREHETVIKKPEVDGHSRRDSDHYLLLSEKESWSSQLAELKRERELNQEQFEALKRSVELFHNSLSLPSTSGNEDILRQRVYDEESLEKKVENSVLKHLSLISSRAITEKSSRQKVVDSDLKIYEFIEALQNRMGSKLKKLSEEAQQVHQTLEKEIAELGSNVAQLHNEHELLREEREVKLAELTRSMIDRDTQQREQLRSMVDSEIRKLVREEIVKKFESRMAAWLEAGEARLRENLLNELRMRKGTSMSVQYVKNETNDTLVESFGLSSVDMSTIRLLISEALKIYDADKTCKVDYALESSGASVLSTRCTKAFEKKSRLESLFGLPLWYSSYSPRQVIQHRSSLASGECWAFQGIGYLVIKLAYPVYVTEVSYEHLPFCLHPDGYTNSAPRKFQIWSLTDVNDVDSKFLIGDYEYDNKGEALQKFAVQHTPADPTPIIELIVSSNWGAEYTCLYRLRVHGRKAAGTSDFYPEVDHSVHEKTAKVTVTEP